MAKVTDEAAPEIEYGIQTIGATFIADWLRSLLADRRERIEEARPQGEARGSAGRRAARVAEPILCSKFRGRVYKRHPMTPERRALLGRLGGLKRAMRAELTGKASALGKRLNQIRWAKTTPEERKAYMAALRARRGALKPGPKDRASTLPGPQTGLCPRIQAVKHD
jgi:hypothetical protein